MCKTDLIDAICRMNPSARPDFLAEFSLGDLDEYRHKLESLREEGLLTLEAEEELQPA
jgi:hypothetical protein